MKFPRLLSIVLSFVTLTVLAESSLPDGYSRLEWIESSGAQYVETGYSPSSTDKVTVRFQFLEPTYADYQALFCARKSGKQTFSCMVLKASKLRLDYNDGTCFTTGEQIQRTDHLLVIDGKNQLYTLDGSQLSATAKSVDFTVGSAFNLFCSEAKTLLGKFRLYYFRVEDEEGNVKVDLRPCRNSDGTIGLYDFAEGRVGFYGNSGTGEFVGSGTQLPAGYEACDWVDSSGMQWLNTEVRPICCDRVDTKIRFHEVVAANYQAVFCARASGGIRTFTCVKNNNNVFRFDRNEGTGDGTSTLRPSAHNDYRIEMDAQTRDCRVNDEVLYNGGNPVKCGTVGGYVVGSPFVLFAGHDGTIGEGHMSMLSKMRLYSFKVLDPNGGLISDLQPCRRVADGCVGVYDIVNNKFLTPSGEGALTASRKVLPREYTEKEWIRSSGAQYVDTAYWPSQMDTVKAKFAFKDSSLRDYQALYCARKDGKQTFSCQLLKDGAKLRFDYNDGTRGFSNALTPKTEYEVEVNGETQTYRLNGNQISVGVKDGTFSVGSSLHLFGTELGGNLASFTLYSFKVLSKDGMVMCDCVPCLRRADGAAGLYDLANDRFLENLGTGRFDIAGQGLLVVFK